MIPLEKFSRREKWVRFISDEWHRRDPIAYLRLCTLLEEHGTTLLAYIRGRRAVLQMERRS